MSSSESTPFLGLTQIGQIALTLADVPAATAFYRDVLGIPFLFSAGRDLSFFDAAGVRLMLTTAQGHGEPGKNSTLYFKVADVVAAHAEIVHRGARDERAPSLVAKLADHELWMAFVRDNEGNLIGLMEERR